MKYLILEDFSGAPAAFIFPERVDHAEMREQLPYGKLLSGGWLHYEPEKGAFHCSGGSQELGIEARPEDLGLILEALRKEPDPA